MAELTVACVLWPGGDFDARDVRALQRGVAEHLPIPHRFVCVTDEPVECEAIAFRHDWWKRVGWWGKLEVFREDMPGDHILYLDLDSLPVGDLSEIAAWRGDFAAMRDVNVVKRLQCSVMSFERGGSAATLYEQFVQRGPKIRKMWTGDQWWITDVLPEAVRLQDHIGGIYSLKRHAKHGPPDDARLIVGHGIPRMSSPDAGWAHGVWRGRAE